uniref:Uncharacterized protein n=1 Tax=Romanomermis culicivorax TaxID=13658 RepID=A0A915HUH3_ROMCU
MSPISTECGFIKCWRSHSDQSIYTQHKGHHRSIADEKPLHTGPTIASESCHSDYSSGQAHSQLISVNKKNIDDKISLTNKARNIRLVDRLNVLLLVNVANVAIPAAKFSPTIVIHWHQPMVKIYDAFYPPTVPTAYRHNSLDGDDQFN